MARKREPDLSIVVTSCNTRDITRKCLARIGKHGGEVAHELIVVDNGSTDGSAEMIEAEFPEASLIRQSAGNGASGGHIPGMKEAKGRYILLLSSDALVTEGVLSKTLAYMDANKRVGILGCRLTDPEGALLLSARRLPGPISKFLTISGLAARFPSSPIFGKENYTWWDHSSPRKVGWVQGSYFMIRRRTMEEIGVPDDGFASQFKEIDYCLSARRRYWDVVFYPDASVVRPGDQSAPNTQDRQSLSIRIANECRYYKKHYGPLRLLAAMGVEYLWNVLVRVRHRLSRRQDSKRKRADAAAVMALITQELVRSARQKAI